MAALAERQNQPMIQGDLPLFEWWPNVPVLDGPVEDGNDDGGDDDEDDNAVGVQGAGAPEVEAQGADKQDAVAAVGDKESDDSEESAVEEPAVEGSDDSEWVPDTGDPVGDGDEEELDEGGVYSHAQQLVYA